MYFCMTCFINCLILNTLCTLSAKKSVSLFNLFQSRPESQSIYLTYYEVRPIILPSTNILLDDGTIRLFLRSAFENRHRLTRTNTLELGLFNTQCPHTDDIKS